MQSMTGYGKGVCEADGRKMTVELKAVNHRFLDLNIKLPRGFAFLDDEVRNQIKSKISRGHIDVFINIEQNAQDELAIEPNLAAVEKYLQIAKDLSDKYGLVNDLTIDNLLRQKDVIIEKEQIIDEDAWKKMLNDSFFTACDNLNFMRNTEGEKIKSNIEEKLELIKSTVSVIKEYAPQQIEIFRAKLTNRVQEILADVAIDDAKLLNEVVFYADKVATDEEFIRLETHIEHFNEIMSKNEPIGRQLDFIVQEMNREANTIGSKCNDVSITNNVLILKTEIEKIREQIQNIE